MHFDGVDGPPAWSGRLDAAIRDSLRGRGIDVWAAESLSILKDRNEWPGSDRTPATVLWLTKRTRRPVVAWARCSAPDARFERPLWSLLWTRRVWTAAADILVADPSGKPKTTQVSVEQKNWLGFTGTNGADLWPVTEPERGRAEKRLLAELASRSVDALVAIDSASTN